MAFCKYCGTQLADGQVCSCEQAQAARQAAAQQAVPNPQPQQQTVPNPQFEQAKQTAAKAQGTVVNATKSLIPFLRSYFSNPARTLQEVMQGDNLTMAITMTIIRALAMSLAIFGVLHSICKYAKKIAIQSMSGFSLNSIGAGVSISAPIIESFLYGILIAVIGMALFILFLFIMVKILKGTTPIRAIYEASACNGVLTSILLLLTFIFSFISLQITLVFLALAILSWVICGVLTAQVVCPNNHMGLFWLLYFLSVAIIFAIGFKIVPALGLKAMGGISVSAYGQSMKLKDAMGDINLSNIRSAISELMDLF